MSNPFSLELDFIRDLFPLLFAALVGAGIGLAYVVSQKGRQAAVRIANACIVLTIVICLIVRVVDDLAAAFIVVGALTLVRLRAAIGDTREFGFLLLSVAAGLGCGERHYEIVILGAVLVCGIVLFLARAPADQFEHRLSATLPTAAVDQARAALSLAGSGHAFRLREADVERASLRVTFQGNRELADAILTRWRELPGVQDLSLDSRPRND